MKISMFCSVPPDCDKCGGENKAYLQITATKEKVLKLCENCIINLILHGEKYENFVNKLIKQFSKSGE